MSKRSQPKNVDNPSKSSTSNIGKNEPKGTSKSANTMTVYASMQRDTEVYFDAGSALLWRKFKRRLENELQKGNCYCLIQEPAPSIDAPVSKEMIYEELINIAELDRDVKFSERRAKIRHRYRRVERADAGSDSDDSTVPDPQLMAAFENVNLGAQNPPANPPVGGEAPPPPAVNNVIPQDGAVVAALIAAAAERRANRVLVRANAVAAQRAKMEAELSEVDEQFIKQCRADELKCRRQAIKEYDLAVERVKTHNNYWAQKQADCLAIFDRCLGPTAKLKIATFLRDKHFVIAWALLHESFVNSISTKPYQIRAKFSTLAFYPELGITVFIAQATELFELLDLSLSREAGDNLLFEDMDRVVEDEAVILERIRYGDGYFDETLSVGSNNSTRANLKLLLSKCASYKHVTKSEVEGVIRERIIHGAKADHKYNLKVTFCEDNQSSFADFISFLHDYEANLDSAKHKSDAVSTAPPKAPRVKKDKDVPSDDEAEKALKATPNGGGGGGKNGGNPKGKESKSGETPREKRVCTYASCPYPNGHTIEFCYTRKADERVNEIKKTSDEQFAKLAADNKALTEMVKKMTAQAPSRRSVDFSSSHIARAQPHFEHDSDPEFYDDELNVIEYLSTDSPCIMDVVGPASASSLQSPSVVSSDPPQPVVLVDNGASCHVWNDVSVFENLVYSKFEVRVAGGGTIKCFGRGDVGFLRNVAFCPKLSYCVVSLNALTSPQSNLLYFAIGDTLEVCARDDLRIVLTAVKRESNQLLYLDNPSQLFAVPLSEVDSSSASTKPLTNQEVRSALRNKLRNIQTNFEPGMPYDIPDLLPAESSVNQLAAAVIASVASTPIATVDVSAAFIEAPILRNPRSDSEVTEVIDATDTVQQTTPLARTATIGTASAVSASSSPLKKLKQTQLPLDLQSSAAKRPRLSVNLSNNSSKPLLPSSAENPIVLEDATANSSSSSEPAQSSSTSTEEVKVEVQSSNEVNAAYQKEVMDGTNEVDEYIDANGEVQVPAAFPASSKIRFIVPNDCRPVKCNFLPRNEIHLLVYCRYAKVSTKSATQLSNFQKTARDYIKRLSYIQVNDSNVYLFFKCNSQSSTYSVVYFNDDQLVVESSTLSDANNFARGFTNMWASAIGVGHVGVFSSPLNDLRSESRVLLTLRYRSNYPLSTLQSAVNQILQHNAAYEDYFDQVQGMILHDGDVMPSMKLFGFPDRVASEVRFVSVLDPDLRVPLLQSSGLDSASTLNSVGELLEICKCVKEAKLCKSVLKTFDSMMDDSNAIVCELDAQAILGLRRVLLSSKRTKDVLNALGELRADLMNNSIEIEYHKSQFEKTHHRENYPSFVDFEGIKKFLESDTPLDKVLPNAFRTEVLEDDSD